MKNPPFVPALNFSAEGFVATADVIASVEAKASKLHHHTAFPLNQIRVNVRREPAYSAVPRFVVSVTIYRTGSNCVAHSVGIEPLPAIEAAFRKIARSVADIHALLPVA